MSTRTLSFGHIIGVDDKNSPSCGIIGQTVPKAGADDRRVQTIAIDLNNPQTIVAVGSMGSGKSYILGALIEMMSMPIENLNALPQAITTVVFHYSDTEDHAPEWTAMQSPNNVPGEVDPLRKTYRAEPKGLPDQILLAPKELVALRQQQYPNIPCHPCVFHPSELDAQSWLILMGAIGKRTPYIQFINDALSRHRKHITTTVLRTEIEQSHLLDDEKKQALMRLQLADKFISPDKVLGELILPGRNIVVDLRDEYLHADDAFAILQVILQITANRRYQGRKFPKCVVFDEFHNYCEDEALVKKLVKTMRLMRHKRTSILIASQDPSSVPPAVLKLQTIAFYLKMASFK